MCRTPASSNASIKRRRSSTDTGASACRPSRGPTSRMSTAHTTSDRWHAVAAVAEGAVLRAGQVEAGNELVAQLLGSDDGVDDELRRQVQQVDVGLVFGPALGDEL